MPSLLSFSQTMSPGQAAYEMWSRMGGQIDGIRMSWFSLNPAEQEGWEAVAMAARNTPGKEN